MLELSDGENAAETRRIGLDLAVNTRCGGIGGAMQRPDSVIGDGRKLLSAKSKFEQSRSLKTTRQSNLSHTHCDISRPCDHAQFPPMRSLVPLLRPLEQQSCLHPFFSSASSNQFSRFSAVRSYSSTPIMEEKFKPAKRVAGQRQDVWSIVNEAAAASPKQPIGKSA